MPDIRCIYQKTITLSTPDHQCIVIGDEIGRAQNSASMSDIIVRYDSSITDYQDVTIHDHGEYLLIQHNGKSILYDQKISQTPVVSDSIFAVFLDITKGYEHLIPFLTETQPSMIILMPTVDQQTAIECASALMKEGLSVPKFLKEGQYITLSD